MRQAPMTSLLRQAALGVENLERAASFYGSTLGLTEIARFDPPGLVFFDLGGVRLLLERAVDPAPGTSVLYLGVADICDRVAELSARGVVFETEPTRIHLDSDGLFGEVGAEEWMAFFADPDGNQLALVETRASSAV